MGIIADRMKQDLARAGLAQRTQKQYFADARALVAHFRRPPADLTQDDLRQYLTVLEGRGVGASRMGQHLAAMKFLYRKTLGQPEKVAWVSFPRVPRRLPKILTPEQLKALLDALQLDVLRVIVMVLYASGLRISEACALKVTDLDSTAGRPLFRAWRSRPQQTRRDASSGRIVDPRHRSAARESELNGVGIG